MTSEPLQRAILWLALASAAGVAVVMLVGRAFDERDILVVALALSTAVLVVLLDRRSRSERRSVSEERDRAEALAASLETHRGELAQQNAELRALLVSRAGDQERIETLYRVGQRLSGELEAIDIARIGLAGLCALAGAAGGALRLQSDLPVVTFGDCPEPLRNSAASVSGLRMEPSPWGATVRVPVMSAGQVLGAAYLALPHVTGIAQLDGPAISHLAAQIAVALDHARVFQAARHQAGIVRAVLDATPDAIHLVDTGGRILTSNEPFNSTLAPVLGPFGGLDATTPETIAEVGDPQAFLADVAALRGDDDLEVVHEFSLADCGRSFVRYTAPVQDRAGERIGRVFVHREVTAERESERVKDEFLALVSHELRTPLTSVIGYLELVLDGEAGDLNEAQERFLGITERNARRLLRLVGDLLVVAQAEAGRMGLTPDTFDMAALAAEQVEACRPTATNTGVRLELEAGAALHVHGDRERLGQVLDNLITNAARYTGDGGVVRVSVTLEDDRVVAAVRDTGPGIPPDELPHVFDRFFRGAAAGTVSGSGLGLAICQLIATAHGGAVEALSPPGEGATFRLVIPAAGADRLAGHMALREAAATT